MPPVVIPEGCLQILLEIHALDESSGKKRAIRRKEDGQRFSTLDHGSEVTLKLSIGQLYSLTLLISPPSSVSNATMQSHQGISALTEPGLDSTGSSGNREVEGASLHNFKWWCDSPLSLNNTRHQLSLSFDVAGFGPIALPLQVKSYADDVKGRDHLILGQPLRHLQFLLKKKSDKVALVGKVTAFGTFHSDDKSKGPSGGAWFLS